MTRLLLMVALGAASYGCAAKSDGYRSPEKVTAAFIEASVVGDEVRQLATFANPERTGHAQMVITKWYDDAQLAHFQLDSIVRAPRQPLGTDTILMIAWGTEPNWSRAEREDESIGGVSIVQSSPEPDELSSTEIARLPRITASYGVWTHRASKRWHVTVQADRLGPLFATTDSIFDRCEYGKDQRPCLGLAQRAVKLSSGVRIVDPQNAAVGADRVIRSVAMLDSVVLENPRYQAWRFRPGGVFEWYVRNQSSQPIRSAYLRIVDGKGTLVTDRAMALNIPPGHRVSGLDLLQNNDYVPPFKYEIINIDIDDN